MRAELLALRDTMDRFTASTLVVMFRLHFSGDVAFERVFGWHSGGCPTFAGVDIWISAVDRMCSPAHGSVVASACPPGLFFTTPTCPSRTGPGSGLYP